VATLIAEILFKQLLICTADNLLNIASTEVRDEASFQGVHSAIVLIGLCIFNYKVNKQAWGSPVIMVLYSVFLIIIITKKS